MEHLRDSETDMRSKVMVKLIEVGFKIDREGDTDISALLDLLFEKVNKEEVSPFKVASDFAAAGNSKLIMIN